MAGAIAVLLGMALVLLALVPPYLKNWKFGGALRETAASSAITQLRDEQVRAVVSQKAAALGLTVPPGQVEVQRDGGRLRLDVRYVVRVETPVYTVDLHFHPAATQ